MRLSSSLLYLSSFVLILILTESKVFTSVRDSNAESFPVTDSIAPSGGSAPFAELLFTNETIILKGSNPSDSQPILAPRLVGEGCQIRNEKGAPTCIPEECGKSPIAWCEKVDGRCYDGSSFKKIQLKDICAGCSCRAWASRTDTKEARIHGYPPDIELKAGRKRRNPSPKGERSGGKNSLATPW